MYLAATGATDVSQRRNPSYFKLSQVTLGETIAVTARRNPTKPKLSQVILGATIAVTARRNPTKPELSEVIQRNAGQRVEIAADTLLG